MLVLIWYCNYNYEHYRVHARNMKTWFHLLKELAILVEKEKQQQKQMWNDYKIL